MTDDRTTLRAVGEALYGPQWQSQLARELKVVNMTVYRWHVGWSPIPTYVWPQLAKLCYERADRLAMLYNRLSRFEEKPGDRPVG